MKLNVALKEWAVVCDLLLSGELAFLLRKGGIAERGGAGVFTLEHDCFALWPSWAHQKPDRIKARWRDRVEVLEEPDEVTVQGYGQAQRIWEVPSREAFDTLEDLHCWTKPQIDMRFDYKPQKPLYLVAVRAWRLASERRIANQPAYSGCRSWVPLAEADGVQTTGATPAMTETVFDATIKRIEAAMGRPGGGLD